MAPQKKKQAPAALSKSTFAETLQTIGIRFGLSKVFDDFLTMAIAVCSYNSATGVAHYEEEYLATIAPYKHSELRHEFPNALVYLIEEMETRLKDHLGNDVLGEFFEQHISNGRNGQFFTPFPICMMMAASLYDGKQADAPTMLSILDPTCGSGRMLLAAQRVCGSQHQYYGIDIDRVCVKMAALNMFLHGMWGSEVMCANALVPDDFVISYRMSFLPLGIFKIEQKEKSRLWHMYINSFRKENTSASTGDNNVSNTDPLHERKGGGGEQLRLF